MIASALATLGLLLLITWIWGSSFAPRAPAAERLAFGILALVGLAWLTMLQGPIGVGLLGRPLWLTAIGLALTVALVAWRRPSLRPGRLSFTPIAVAVIATALVTFPGFFVTTPQLWPSHYDMLWHQGWIRQLAAGMSAPGGIYVGEPNSYPWLYHSISAWILGTMPGNLNAALLAVDVAGVLAGWLGIWLLTRELGASSGAATWAAGLLTATAGFGWIWQHAPAAAMRQNGIDLGPYHGDLVLYNVLNPALGDVPPLIPRDLALCLTPLALWLLVRGLGRGPKAFLWLAGAAMSFAFLVGPLAGGFCAAWTIALAIQARDRGVWRVAVAAAGVAAVWLVPLAVAYHHYHGFVSITNVPPVNPTIPEAIIALGLLLPLGLAGTAWVMWRPGNLSRWSVALLVIVPAIACAAGALVGQGQDVLGTPALLRWSRYLPYLGLGLAIPAGIAANRITSALARRPGRVVAAAAAVVLVAVAVPSTVLATVAEVRQHFPRPLVCSAWPSPTSLTAVAIHQPRADQVSLELFANAAAPSVFLRLVRSKVRFRTFLDRPPTNKERVTWYHTMMRDRILPPDVTWVVSSVFRTPAFKAVGFKRVGMCTIVGHTYDVLQRR